MFLGNGQEVQLVFDLSRGEWDPTATTKKVNFVVAHNAGIAGAFFRDANGEYPDATAPTFEADADAATVPWGDFGTIYPPSAGFGTIDQQSAEFIMNAAIKVVGKLPLVIDWEVEGVTWQMAYQYIAKVMLAFPGKEILIYSRAEFLARMLPNRILQASSYKWFQQFQIWQAQYGVSAPAALPAGFTRVLWQWTDRADASLYGINPTQAKGVDMSYFFGSMNDFNTRFGLLATPPVPPPPPVPQPSGQPISITVHYAGAPDKEITL